MKVNSEKMDPKTLEGEAPSSSSSSSYGWKERIFIPTLLAGIVGGGVGLVSKHRKVHGLANISATYATNFAIITGCYYGAREIVMRSRLSHPDDLVNSAFAGFGTGAILGRLQGGKYGAVKYAVIFSVVGTSVDYAAIKLKPVLRSYTESLLGKDGGGFKWPEWSPIQVLDEEKLAAKRAREKELYSQRILGKINKEEP